MKMFVTDYDDTLYLNDDDIKKNIKRLKELQKNNFIIVISTGRSYPSIKNQINIHQIPYDYVACADGSIIYDNNGQIIDMFKMKKDIIPVIQNFYQDLNYEEIQFSYPEGYSNLLQDSKVILGINICLSNENYTDQLEKNFLKLKKKYPQYNYLAYTHPHFSYLCVKPIDVSKSYAIKVLSDKLRINEKDIYVIGDSSNDVEMLNDYHGVGMKNSCKEVLNIVHKTYKTVTDYINDILKEKH